MTSRIVHTLALSCLALALTGCASGPKRPDPTPLAAITPTLHPTQVWSASIGQGSAALAPVLAVDRVVVASRDGTVAAFDAEHGRTLWQAHVDGGCSAGVGSDGRFSAVVDQSNGVVAIGPQGQLLWRYQLPASVQTPPAVFNGRIVVQSADQNLWAFNAANGQLLWSVDGQAPALLLQRGAGILRVGPQLLLGDAMGHLDVVDLADGAVRGTLPLARSTGATEVERMVAVTGAPSLAGGVVCARAYQTAISCVDLADGKQRWSVKADGASAVSQDGTLLAAAQSDGRVQGLRVADGSVAWTQDGLRYRHLSAPLLIDGVVAVGDADGVVSLLAASDGQPQARISTDGSAIQQQPLAFGHDLLIVTRSGQVSRWHLR